jgi:hypothetical protein
MMAVRISACLMIAALGATMLSAPVLGKVRSHTENEMRLEKIARKLRILPFSELPSQGSHDLKIEISDTLDRKIKAKGFDCKISGRPKTKVASIAQQINQYWNEGLAFDSEVSEKAAKPLPIATLHIKNTASVQRCEEYGFFKKRCFIKTQIAGDVETRDESGRAVFLPIETEVVRKIRSGIICTDGALFEDDYYLYNDVNFYALFNGGENASVALVNREAVIKLVEIAKSRLGNNDLAARDGVSSLYR